MLKKTLYTALAVSWLILCGSAMAEQTRRISVFGSSVASGIAAQDNHGYWYMLKDGLAPHGWEVSSCSRGGDRTNRILDRFDDLLSQEPGYVFIGLSLANEGILSQGTEEKEKVFRQYLWGMKALIALIRDQNMTPVAGLCYPSRDYRQEEYQYIKRMNLLINSWDVPSTNFLGAIEDGQGRWVEGFSHDAGHPNTAGHREMFYAIVPSLFDALEAGKPTPQKAAESGSLRLGREHPGSVSFKAADTIHSWATAFSIRCSQDGELAVIEGDKHSVRISIRDGQIACQTADQKAITSPVKVNNAQWHCVAVSHRYAQKQTLLFVDGQLAGTMDDQFEPHIFTLSGGHQSPDQVDFKDWFVYRSALNDMEAKALADGQLLQASLEVYAPLRDAALTDGQSAENRAQSMSQVFFETIRPHELQ